MLDESDIRRVQRYLAHQLRFLVAALAGERVVDMVDQTRFVHRAAVREGGERERELDRGVGVVALADADRDRFSRVPPPLLRAPEAPGFPFG